MSRIVKTTTKLALIGALTFGLGGSAMAMTPFNKGHNFHTPKSAKTRVVKRYAYTRPMFYRSVVTQKTPVTPTRSYTARANVR
jgi:hypothetical protein